MLMSWKLKPNLFFKKKFLIPAVHSVLFVLFQQFAGINFILTNLIQIFEGANISIDENYASVLVSLGGVVGCIASTFLIEKLGRRPTWILSSFIQTGALIVFWINGIAHGPGILPVISLIIYVIGMGIGFGPIPWLIVPELFPSSVRSFFQSIVTSLNWIAASFTTLVFPLIADAIGFNWPVFIFAIICCLAGIYGIFWMPETKGKEAGAEFTTEMDLEFNPTQTDDRSILRSQINPIIT